jgi:hypothetical protein
MTVMIHYTLPDGSEDALMLEGTEEQIRERAQEYVKFRGATDPWSEVLEEDAV